MVGDPTTVLDQEPAPSPDRNTLTSPKRTKTDYPDSSDPFRCTESLPLPSTVSSTVPGYVVPSTSFDLGPWPSEHTNSIIKRLPRTIAVPETPPRTQKRILDGRTQGAVQSLRNPAPVPTGDEPSSALRRECHYVSP